MIPGIRASVREAGSSPFLWIASDTPLRTLNTSVWGGGFGWHRHIVNRQVTKSYDSSDPAAEMERYLSAAGIEPTDACAMLTAAYVRDAGYAEESCRISENGEGGEVSEVGRVGGAGRADRDGKIRQSGEAGGLGEVGRVDAIGEAGGAVRAGEAVEPAELRVAAWVTAGLGNAARAGEARPLDRLYPGTVNIIVAVDGRMTDAAMANAVITATEAKAAVFQDLRIRVGGTGSIATGTTTDAVLVAATGRGRRDYVYAGTATRLGYLLSRAVYAAAEQACRRWMERSAER